MRHILCYGDSNTWGYTPGTGERHAPDVRWTGVLRRLLGEGWEVLEEGMNGNGRILVRPSGTEPVIRIMVEGLDREAIMNAAKSMEQIIIERLGYNEDCKGLERI